MLSPFLVSLQKPPIPSLTPLITNLPSLASWPWHSPILVHRAFTGPRASPPIDDWLGHLLLHIQLCILWLVFCPWELWGYWLVHIVVPPTGLQMPSAPSVLSLAPSLGTLCSVQWMAVSIHFYICQALAVPLRRQLYQAPVNMHFLSWTIVSGFGKCIWDGSPGGAVCGWPFLQSLLHTLSPYFLPLVFCSPSKKDWSTHTLVFLLLELSITLYDIYFYMCFPFPYTWQVYLYPLRCVCFIRTGSIFTNIILINILFRLKIHSCAKERTIVSIISWKLKNEM